MSALALSGRTLGAHPRLAHPGYDRRALVPAVVHLGVGHFHRSHQAVYLDDLARRGHTGWGLVGVGLRRRSLTDALRAQDGLYTVVERGARRDRARVVGVMGRSLLAADGPRRVVAALTDQRTRLVTLTVTGAGYGSAGVASPIELLVEGLAARRRADRSPFTVLSCDNLADNGEHTRQAVLELAGRRDADLARWIAVHGAFPASMVDRITPQTSDADRAALASRFGVLDRAPVVTEPFSDWVVEDAFCAGRPPLDEVGVRFVPDVRPYAVAKTRLLNAAHLLLGSLGRVAGAATMGELMADPAMRRFVDALMADEVVPSLPPVALDLPAYRRSLVDRLANARMGDPLERLCRDVSLKLPRHVVPSILAARADGREHPLLTIAVAGVCRLLRGADDRGRPLTLDDPAAARLRVLADVGGDDPRPLLSDRAVFGALGDDPAFVEELAAALASVDAVGARATVARAAGAAELLAA